MTYKQKAEKYILDNQLVDKNLAVIPLIGFAQFLDNQEQSQTLEDRVKKIEEWIDFWETVPTPWNKDK